MNNHSDERSSDAESDWDRDIDGFNDFVRGVEMAVARKTRCSLCAGQLRPYKQAEIGPGVWKCDRCGDEQIVRVDG